MDVDRPVQNDKESSSPSLNSSQQEAVDHTGGHLLIVAGPGTGKTHTLTCRIARTIGRLTASERILAITFTNKAAQEMKERLGRMGVGQRLASGRVEVGTFHQFGWQVLRNNALSQAHPGFRILGEEEADGIAKQVWPDLTAKERRLFLERISRWKSCDFGKLPPEEVIDYNRFLRENRLYDFDDLLLDTINLLRRNEKLLARLQMTYRFIFVDEYQDINPAQHILLKLLVRSGACPEQGSAVPPKAGQEAGPRRRVELTAIGDPNQAIYGFRGSDVRYFDSFATDFPGARLLTLTENYRSAANILSACGQVIARNKSVYVPELTARIYAEGRLTMYEAPTEKAEAEYVVHQIEKMVGGTSMFSQDSGRVEREEEGQCSFGDIAVLFRINSQGALLEKAFARSGIPYLWAVKAKAAAAVDVICPPHGPEVTLLAEKVSLMTIHSAKGLEFPVVFIVGCEETLLPLNLAGLQSDIEEERRLFYVGMTRAKERLYLVRSKRRQLFGKLLENPPSVFLSEIEEGLKEYEKTHPLPKRRKKEGEQMKLF